MCGGTFKFCSNDNVFGKILVCWPNTCTKSSITIAMLLTCDPLSYSEWTPHVQTVAPTKSAFITVILGFRNTGQDMLLTEPGHDCFFEGWIPGPSWYCELHSSEPDGLQSCEPRLSSWCSLKLFRDCSSSGFTQHHSARQCFALYHSNCECSQCADL